MKHSACARIVNRARTPKSEKLKLGGALWPLAGARFIVKSSPLSSHFLLIGSILAACAYAHAQEGTSPEAAPGGGEAPSAQPGIERVPVQTPDATTAPVETVAGTSDIAANSSRLTAASVSYQGGTIVAQGTAGNPAVYQSALGRLEADEVRLDTIKQTVSAKGQVRLIRQGEVDRRELRAGSLDKLRRREAFTQTLSGQNLYFDFKTQKGTLDSAIVRSQADLNARQLEINGKNYTAYHVVVRPGGLTEEERRIYGTPPLNIRAREVDVRPGRRLNSFSLSARGAGLYFGNTRLLPIPGGVLGLGGGKNQHDLKVTPDVSFNSADRFLIAARVGFPLAANPRQLSLITNLGYSQRVGFRGGAALASTQNIGEFRLSAQRRDVITTQLTNRLELDRRPELTFQSPAFATFVLPRFGKSGFSVDGGYGSFLERSTLSGDPIGGVSSDRLQGRLLFSTRLDARSGPFVRAFASSARYSKNRQNYNAQGVQLGFAGQLMPRINGEVSLRLTNTSGQTPFRFDLIEIPRELRTTFDVSLTPRYVVPIDIRYDLSRSSVRDSTFGFLRSYKVFAYGVVYQTSRRDLRLEVRSAF